MACTLHVAWDDRLAGYDFGSAGWLRAFDAVVPPLLRAFRPQILDSQHGCDIHRLDPLANLRLSIDAQRVAYAAIHQLADEAAGAARC